MLRLPRFGCSIKGWNEPMATPPVPRRRPRCASPVTACSTLMTSAPQSVRTAPADGVNVNWATSTILTPFIGWCTGSTLRLVGGFQGCWPAAAGWNHTLGPSVGEHGKTMPAPDGGGVRLLGVVPVDVPTREALQHLVQSHPALEARQVAAEAEVDPVPEGEVVRHLPVDIEAI